MAHPEKAARDNFFVHGNIEVKKTGRVAEKIGPGGKRAVLVEITPVSPDDGTWKRWVNPSVLFSIKVEPGEKEE